MNIWDIGGQDRIRKLWQHYYDSCDGLIFVVDTNDVERFPEVKEELAKIHRAVHLENVPFLIFANKQDLPHAAQIHKMDLGLSSMRNRKWKIQACSAMTGDGLYQGLDWLRCEMMNKK
jgi:small GTP-binding protein